jgi:hypothetical protein
MYQSVHHMQRYVVGAAGIMTAMVVSFSIAMIRVSSTQKFAGQPFNSQTCATDTPNQRQVVSWFQTCRPISSVSKNS